LERAWKQLESAVSNSSSACQRALRFVREEFESLEKRLGEGIRLDTVIDKNAPVFDEENPVEQDVEEEVQHVPVVEEVNAIDAMTSMSSHPNHDLLPHNVF
jgi:hypothetical protein